MSSIYLAGTNQGKIRTEAARSIKEQVFRKLSFPLGEIKKGRRKTTFEDARRTVIHRILANLLGLRSASLFYPELRVHPRSRGAQ